MSPPVPSRRRHHRREQGGEDRGGDAQEQEEQLRIEGVAAAGVELRPEVVPHRSPAGEQCFQVVGGGQDLGERGGWIRRKGRRIELDV